MLGYLFGTSDPKNKPETSADNEPKTSGENDANPMLEFIIKEMQQKGNNILIEKNGKTETYFYAAQRLKLAKTLSSSKPCKILSNQLLDKLVAIAKFCPTVATKANSAVREQIKYIADYLSEDVLVPVPEIDAYEKLLELMDAKGDALLIETSPLEKIKKSYKDAAEDLKSFTSAKDQIGKTDNSISKIIRANLKQLVSNKPLSGYDLAIMNQVITEQTQLLTSFLLLQREKTEALEELKDQLVEKGDTTILSHGSVRKSCQDALYLLHGVTADQLRKVPESNQIVTRKLELKLNDLFKTAPCVCFGKKPESLMNTVLEETSNFLAYNFTRPLHLKTCHCPTSTYMECDMKERGNQRNAERRQCRCNHQLEGPTTPGIGVAECPVMGSRTIDIPTPPCPDQDEGQPRPCPDSP